MAIFLPKIVSSHVPVGCITLLLIASFAFGIAVSADMPMTSCPLMGMEAICQMNPLDHIALWQQMFASVLANNASSVLFLLIAFLVFSLQRFRRLRIPHPRAHHQALGLRARTAVIYNPLQEALSAGILHPKIF